MSKIYKGYELLKAMVEGEIEEGTRFKAFGMIWIFRNNSLYNYESDEYIEYYTDIVVTAKEKFELIEENTIDIEKNTIDIDKLEEINDTNFDSLNMTEQEIDFYHNFTRTKINELVQAIKQLNKRIEELEKNNDN